MAALLSERDLSFILYELLDTESLLQRPRYAAHSREVFDAILESARQIAEDLLAPHLAKGDAEEPTFNAGAARLIPETQAAWQGIADGGFLCAHWGEDEGGSQIPEPVARAAMAYFKAANVATSTYAWLTVGAANLLRAFGTREQKRCFLAAMGDGRCSGTMALTEPNQGSSLGDIRTRAEPQRDGSYRLFGQKMFISGGDHDLTRNIVHMVLARVTGAPAGAKGISLFAVPKFLVDEAGTPIERNDVQLAGMIHKMGWRNTTSTVLSFGENGGAVGTLIGEPGKGLAHMFQMMNESRIEIGLCAATIAYRAYLLTLEYARTRRQGRLPSTKNPGAPQVTLVEHADVRRMLLAQKAYAEGALAMCLDASALFEDQHTHPDASVRREAALLLDLLTPIVKSWSSRYGCTANDLGIQVLGGYGYTREYPLEQLYRDQRLNPIHEGAEAIHALDLLARKVRMHDGAAYRLLRSRIDAAVDMARRSPAINDLAAPFADPLQRIDAVTEQLTALQSTDPDLALANAALYLDAFGRIAAGWIWVRQALAAQRGLESADAAQQDFYSGKLHAARYYCTWELPAAVPMLNLLSRVDRIPFDMRDTWF